MHGGMRLGVYAFVLWHCLNIFRLLQSLLGIGFLLKSILFAPVRFLCLPNRGDVREHVYWPIGDIQEDADRSLDDFALGNCGNLWWMRSGCTLRPLGDTAALSVADRKGFSRFSTQGPYLRIGSCSQELAPVCRNAWQGC